jgi:hypothetical protein
MEEELNEGEEKENQEFIGGEEKEELSGREEKEKEEFSGGKRRRWRS